MRTPGLPKAQSGLERLRHEQRYHRKEFSDYDEVRLVAFSFPKLAVQFLANGKEVIMLELGTWAVVPSESPKRKRIEPSSFERWSLLKEMPARKKRSAHTHFEERAKLIGRIKLRSVADSNIISRNNLSAWQSIFAAIRLVSFITALAPRIIEPKDIWNDRLVQAIRGLRLLFYSGAIILQIRLGCGWNGGPR